MSGSFSVNDTTREYFGDPLIKYVEQNMLTRHDVPLHSQADCATPQAKRSISAAFGHAATAQKQDEFCANMKERAGVFHYRGIEEETNKTSSGVVFASPTETLLDMTAGRVGGAFKPAVSLKDVDAFFLMHETHHENSFTKDPSTLHVGGYEEFESDMIARQMYGRALKEGIVTDPGVPDAVRGGRALMAMTNSRVYDVASIAGAPGVSIKTEEDYKKAHSDIGKVRNKVHEAIGKDIISADEKDEARYSALKETVLSAPEGAFDRATVDKFENEPENEAELKEHQKESLASVNVPDNLREAHAFNENIRMMIAERRAGESAAKDQPELAYQTTRRMLVKGEFDDTVNGKAFAKEYVRAAETYAPEHFQTDGQITYPKEVSTGPENVAPRMAVANNAQFQMSP